MRLLIKNGRVIDPANNLDGLYDVLIEDFKIIRLGENIKNSAEEVIDASGLVIMPGLVDMHVHLREPGREDKETICSATKAALAAGITSVLAMPNTNPVIDTLANIKLLKEIIKRSAKANVFICGAITKGLKGEELAEIGRLKKEGALAISDDGVSVDNERIMLEAFRHAKAEKIPVICHCEDKLLSQKGVVNLGLTSTRMGLRGISRESEYKRIERDISLATKAGANIHIAHVSCRESVESIAKAKKKGIKVTAEATPHHFSLTEEMVLGFDPNFKMNPPLRGSDDRLAIQQGLSDGTIDVIASDHAPHTENEKEIEFERAAFGVIGLETELAVSIGELVQTGILDWKGLVEKLALNPARILGIDRGKLGIGKVADLIVVNPQIDWQVKKNDFISKSKNSPFIDRRLKGKVVYTVLGGKIAYRNIN
jgi:dihydroorotase